MSGKPIEQIVFLLLAGCAGLAVSKQNITVVHGPDYPHVDFAVFASLTQNLTKPIILRGFFNASEWADICDCTSHIFDGFRLPDVKGNSRINNATILTSMDANDFYYNRACQNTTDYMFYDAEFGSLYDGAFSHFNEKLRDTYGLTTRFEDVAYSSDWYNELFLGGQPYEFPPPTKNTGGSNPHRAPVLNYFIQFCGAKQWTIHPFETKFVVRRVSADELPNTDYSDRAVWATLNLTETSLFHPDRKEMERRVLEFDEHEDSLHGVVHPGDVLLNPPWLWHMIRNGPGLNFAVTYKQIGFDMWALVNNAPDWSQLALQRALADHTSPGGRERILPSNGLPTRFDVVYNGRKVVIGITSPIESYVSLSAQVLSFKLNDLLDVRPGLYTFVLVVLAFLFWRQSRRGEFTSR